MRPSGAERSHVRHDPRRLQHGAHQEQDPGAILLTAYLGAATATNLRIGDPIIFPIVIGVWIWAGVYLRDARLAALVPRRQRIGID